MLRAFLSKPYPYLGHLKKDILRNAGIGMFVALFLIVFKPFQIEFWQTDHKTLKLIGFGCVSFLIPSLSGFVLDCAPAKLKDNWTIGREMLLLIMVLVAIAAGNFAYGVMLNIMPPVINAWLFALSSTFLIGVFPVGLHVIRKHNQLLRINLEQSLILNSELRQQHPATTETMAATTSPEITSDHIVLKAENEKDEVQISATELLFIESADNYATLVSVINGKKKKELIRSSLKRIEGQLNHPDIIRCHRAYIINLSKIKNVEGNAAGYKLYFNDCDDMVPVSRSYVQSLGEKLKQRS